MMHKHDIFYLFPSDMNFFFIIPTKLYYVKRYAPIKNSVCDVRCKENICGGSRVNGVKESTLEGGHSQSYIDILCWEAKA